MEKKPLIGLERKMNRFNFSQQGAAPYLDAFTGDSDKKREKSFNINEIRDIKRGRNQELGSLGINTYGRGNRLSEGAQAAAAKESGRVAGSRMADLATKYSWGGTGGLAGEVGRLLYKKLPGKLGEVVGSGAYGALKGLDYASGAIGPAASLYGAYSGAKGAFDDDNTAVSRAGHGLGAVGSTGSAILGTMAALGSANAWNPLGWGLLAASGFGGLLGALGGKNSKGSQAQMRGIHNKYMVNNDG